MSELFVARVTDVSPRSAKLAVRSVHPDSGPVQPTATFALMLIFDPILNSPYSTMRAYSHLEASPLAQVMDMDTYLSPTWVKANARAYVAKAKLSRGVLEIWPTHPGWIEHLRKGMAWDTAAYDLGPGEPTPPRAPAPPIPMTRSQNPKKGFRAGTPRNRHLKITRGLFPREGASKYLAEPIHKKPEEMARAVKKLLGEPILVVPKRGPPQVGTIVELRSDAVYIYNETRTGGWNSRPLAFRDLKSLGRAWLKVPVTPTRDADTKPAPAKKVAKATKKKATKSTTTKAKSTAKKVARSTAKKVAKSTAKKTKSIAKKSTAKKIARPAAKKTAKRPTKR